MRSLRVLVALLSAALIATSGAVASAAPGSTPAAQQAAPSADRGSSRLTPRERKLARKKTCTKRQAKRTPVRCKRIAAAKAKRAALSARPPVAPAAPAARPSGNVVPATGAIPAPDADSFTLAVIPDTQNEVFGSDTRMRQRSEWLAANRQRLGLAFVDHIGDVTNWGWLEPAQLQVASDGMRPLEAAAIPYSLSIGNHDTGAVGWNDKTRTYGGGAYVQNPECRPRLGAGCDTRLLARRTTEFNDVFTAQRFGAVRGAYEAGKIDNTFSTFVAGGRQWLVLNLELWPRAGVVDWARQVVASHPQHNVVISTHSYLDGDGGGIYGGADYGDTSPQQLWSRLVSQYPNIVMVLSGHTGSGAVRLDTGVHGNKVVSLLQAFHHNQANPVRLVRVEPDGDLYTWVTSPNGKGGDFSGYDREVHGLSLH